MPQPQWAQSTGKALADSGAQSNLWSLRGFLNAGFSRDDLLPVTLPLKAANKSPIPIAGAFFSNISGFTSGGERVSCHALIYVSELAHGFYLSYDTLLDLGILSICFPEVGSAWQNTPAAPRPKHVEGPVTNTNTVTGASDGTTASPSTHPQQQ